MVAQLPRGHPELNRTPDFAHFSEPAEPTESSEPTDSAEPAGLPELRAVAASLLARMADLRERDQPVPDALFRAAQRFQPLLDGVDPESEDELDELWGLALALPGLLRGLLVRDGVEDVESRGA
ncbi:hypothetical protein [Streptacidiphilus fuscans]|uniref:Uncharacterized protein n=1 Tax=Streptacidiphilus fuscans TaxID=2789292 RepID=A0A931B4G8_9ACTN|nr:hypothetical protein [Streptacidiphilus fuscans]MBF9070061.1 hypothetical protein [Streptacidiphilus fuscans]